MASQINDNDEKDENNDVSQISQSEQEKYKLFRQQDIQRLNDAGYSTYPHKFCPDIHNYDTNDTKYRYTQRDIVKYRAMYNEVLNPGDHLDVKDDYTYLIGRIYTIRVASKKLIFIDIHQEGYKVQVMANFKMYLNGDDHFNLMTSVFRIGDLVGVAVIPAKTRKGELSLIPHQMALLAPCLLMLPVRSYEDAEGNMISGLQNKEIRFRQRYLDLIINEENLRNFHKRSQIIKNVRRYLENSLNLIEVDTPILNPNVGGAIAKPFETYSADYNCQMFMRIAPELYLKMLIVGGFKGVFEIGKQFRNEANDQTHNCEFTSLEYYIQNCDFNDLMEQCESMLHQVVKVVNGSMVVEYDGKNIDFTPPYKKLDMLSTLEEHTGLVLPKDLSTDEARIFLDEACAKLEVDCSPPRTTARLLDKMVGQYIEPQCINPTFITGHPQIMSPLAKWDRNGTCRTERFELFVNGTELANAYTELNDPAIQLDRFSAQAKDKTMGDDEAMAVDTGFVKALEYGLMPTGGFGMGIDRLVMFLTNNTSIREIILFPTMKPLN